MPGLAKALSDKELQLVTKKLSPKCGDKKSSGSSPAKRFTFEQPFNSRIITVISADAADKNKLKDSAPGMPASRNNSTQLVPSTSSKPADVMKFFNTKSSSPHRNSMEFSRYTCITSSRFLSWQKSSSLNSQSSTFRADLDSARSSQFLPSPRVTFRNSQPPTPGQSSNFSVTPRSNPSAISSQLNGTDLEVCKRQLNTEIKVFPFWGDLKHFSCSERSYVPTKEDLDRENYVYKFEENRKKSPFDAPYKEFYARIRKEVMNVSSRCSK